ncbi:MAG: hypothetical protein K5683_01555 [Prevotella sp.]|nr:hypothetical protein [Prevotella sp.]
MKRLQNKIAEGGLALPMTALLGIAVWLQSGLITHQLWPQLACFIVSVYLLREMSNHNSLLRVRSRMVSSTFIMLSCTASFLFPQLVGIFVQLCFIIALIMLFQTYQDQQATGTSYYAFLFVSLSSLAYVHTLLYVPLLWLLMATQLQSFSWRTWLSSFLGVLTPYWFILIWLLTPFSHTEEAGIDLSMLGTHFSKLAQIEWSLQSLDLSRIIVLVFTLVLAAIAIAHFWQRSFEDKIRIRLLYGFFTTMTTVTLAVIILQPHHYDVLMCIAFVCASPLIAHLLTFTSSRLSNIMFFVTLALTLVIIVLNLFVISQ